MRIGEGISGALFNDSSRCFRYALWRLWQPSSDNLLFIGLNPATANDIKDDPTIRSLVRIAKYWHYGGLFVGNLFSFVTSNPDNLWSQSSIEQPDGANDVAIKQMQQLSAKVLVGWGNEGKNAGITPTYILRLLGQPVYCLKKTKLGEPTHPLYFPSWTPLIPYERK